MGQDKAALPWNGRPLLSHIVQTIDPLAREVIVVRAAGQALPELNVRYVLDRISRAGPLGGLEAGLSAMKTEYALVVGCDMPGLNRSVLRALLEERFGYDGVVPFVRGRLQPLHAVYGQGVLPQVRVLLEGGERRMDALIRCSKVKQLDEAFFRTLDPALGSFENFNR